MQTELAEQHEYPTHHHPPEPEGKDEWAKKKTEQDEEDECILDVIDVNIVKMRPRRRPSGTRTRQ